MVLQAVIQKIRYDALLGMHAIHEDVSIIPCSSITGLSSFCFEKSAIMKAKSDNTYSALDDLVYWLYYNHGIMYALAHL